MKSTDYEKLVTHLKVSGFVFANSEIYNGLANTWDFGPLGVELKNNLKQAWWKRFVQLEDNNVGLDASILMNKKVWQASGHLANFSDPLIDCKYCKTRYRADKLIEDFDPAVSTEKMTSDDLQNYIKEKGIPCPNCHKTEFTPIRKFNLMFKTFQGVVEDLSNEIYLRPETAQGIFVNYKNIQRSLRLKVPFGVCQIGKVFRNEITPGNFIFRVREFEQMELEFFCKPGTDLDYYAYFQRECLNFLINLGVKRDNLRLREHSQEELAFYSKGTSDIEYLFPFGWGELWGIADRSDYDLKVHSLNSGTDLDYLDPLTNEKYIPYVVEPSLGVERLFLTVLCDAFEEQQLEKDTRIVLHLDPRLAPFKVAVQPLSKKDDLLEKANKVYRVLQKEYRTDFDDTGSIGKRYRRQDAIGTPFCLTVDFDSIEGENKDTYTLRDRDSMLNYASDGSLVSREVGSNLTRLTLDDVLKILKEKISWH
ncbi:MAG: glycine--tRNA ligase [Bacillales bacterium]|jgi:glycyl-tRNA synthetase|nr:glycine--tRNA ligase [Bacillales bacterium]